MTPLIGAGRYERSEERTNQRNGVRHRQWDRRTGTFDLAIPKLRSGSYFPGWLEPRRRSEQALVTVVAEAYVLGASTRKRRDESRLGVEALVQTLGIAGLSKSEVSRLCAVLDGQVQAFLTRRLDADYPYVYVDARYEHVREDERVQSMAVVIAYGIRSDGVREVLGLDVTASEELEHWRGFLQSLVARDVRPRWRGRGSEARGQRRPPRSAAGDRRGLCRSKLAALSGSLSQEPTLARIQERSADGGGDATADLPATKPRAGPGVAFPGVRASWAALS